MSVQLKRFGMYSYGLRQWTQRSVDTDPLLRSAKYDEGRQGHRFTGTRMDLATATRPFDLSQELYVRPDQCEARRSSHAEACVTGRGPRPRCDINALVLYSLRIAGASALVNRGVPDHVIQSTGRWKSLAFLAYIRLATRAYNDALEKLCDLGTLTIEDVRRMMPGMKRA